jgi:hypothetical protein
MVETRATTPPELMDALCEADNVTGAAVTAPFETDDGEVHARFGLFVGPSEDEAELQTFEIDREQIEELSEVFTRMAEEASGVTRGADDE